MKIKFKIRYVFILIICILVGAVVIVIYNNNNHWKEKKVYVSSLIQDSITIETPWEEQIVCQQFNSFDYNNSTYSSRDTKILDNMIENELYSTILTGYDSINDIFYKKSATIYSIENYSQNCVVAIKFEEDTDYYVYINLNYIPTTLGQLINDLNLEETMIFNSVWYEYEKNNSETDTIEFPNVSCEIIWDMLLDDTSVKNIQNETISYDKIIDINLDIAQLGYKDITIFLSSDGYLIIDIFNERYNFYIGKEKVENFVNYIIENCEGYKIVYVYDEEEDDNSSGKILKFDKSTNQTIVITTNTTNSNEDAYSNSYNPTK